jgi:hypothetical protein
MELREWEWGMPRRYAKEEKRTLAPRTISLASVSLTFVSSLTSGQSPTNTVCAEGTTAGACEDDGIVEEAPGTIVEVLPERRPSGSGMEY